MRRSELAGLDVAHIQQRNGRWLLADLVGKHGRIRSVPIPPWALAALVRWQAAAGIIDGPVFRRVTRHGTVASRKFSLQAVFEIVKFYAKAIGVDVEPHDAPRTFAKLAHLGHAPLEQIQLSLGHASVITTEIYLGVKQNFDDAPCDHLGLMQR